MLKIMGWSLILVGGLGFGDAAARELGKRVAQLEELQRLLLILQGEIRCVRLTLPAVCELLAKDTKAPFQQFFWKVSEDLGKRTGQTAGEIWSRNLKEIQKLLFLTKKEQQDLEEFGTTVGTDGYAHAVERHSVLSGENNVKSCRGKSSSRQPTEAVPVSGRAGWSSIGACDHVGLVT